jgi:hypothetical protein
MGTSLGLGSDICFTFWDGVEFEFRDMQPIQSHVQYLPA